MSEISFKASITNLKSDYLKTMFESKTAADAIHKTEFYDVDSKKSLDKLLSIFEILKIKEAENLINKLRKKTQKRAT